MTDSESEDQWRSKVEELKREKRKAKTAITKHLNIIAERVPDGEDIQQVLRRLDDLQEIALDLLDRLAKLYKENKLRDMEIKMGEEAEELMERIEKEACVARQTLTSMSKTADTTQGSIAGSTESKSKESSGFGNLERIKIPTFSGNKNEYSHWNATFTSCVDETSMTAQFKMLRLESCLSGEALDTIKGLGYSETAYNAAKSRLARKYGGNRREVQSHLDELLKLRPIKEESPKALEQFADMLERAIVKLQENDRKSDLEVGTLYTLILEKLPERFYK